MARIALVLAALALAAVTPGCASLAAVAGSLRPVHVTTPELGACVGLRIPLGTHHGAATSGLSLLCQDPAVPAGSTPPPAAGSTAPPAAVLRVEVLTVPAPPPVPVESLRAPGSAP